MILQNTIFANGIGNTMKRLGGECRAFRHRAEDFVSQAPFRLIFSSPLLRKFFRVRETCLSHRDMMYSLTTDGRMYRLRWLGFVNACVDYDGALYDFSLNRGRTPSEVKAHFRWVILPSYERERDWREALREYRRIEAARVSAHRTR